MGAPGNDPRDENNLTWRDFAWRASPIRDTHKRITWYGGKRELPMITTPNLQNEILDSLRTRCIDPARILQDRRRATIAP